MEPKGHAIKVEDKHWMTIMEMSACGKYCGKDTKSL